MLKNAIAGHSLPERICLTQYNTVYQILVLRHYEQGRVLITGLGTQARVWVRFVKQLVDNHIVRNHLKVIWSKIVCQ